MSKCIIFDLDGTLINLPIRYELIQKRLKELFDTDSELTPLIPSIIHQANNNQNLIDTAFELLCDEELIASECLEQIEGSQELIDEILSKNYTISLVTMQCKKVAEIILKKINLFEKFSSVITRDDSTDRFLQIKKTCELLDFMPSDVIMIGDRIHDINSAKKAGCRSILVNRPDQNSKILHELRNTL
tara:strand:- start:150 stop:713 length:564 start_codon:yes stop_codon:yes gene_type:complete